jgi:hypothetical protein
MKNNNDEESEMSQPPLILEARRMKTNISKLRGLTGFAFILLAGLLAACQGVPASGDAQDQTGAPALSVRERVQRGKALFDEKCKTVAGEKIYKTVRDVEGVLLLKIRPRPRGNELSDKMWPGAAFAIEATGDGFIKTFLGYEYGGHTLNGTPTPVTPQYRGHIFSNPGGIPGYRWVEVIDEKDGKRYRYTESIKEVTHTQSITIGGDGKTQFKAKEFVLDHVPVPGPEPRYAVTYEDHVIPEERALWLASSTVKVLDRQTGEVLGEMTRYAWSAGAPTSYNPTPWLTAYKCPGHARGASAATRKFVDQVLIPAKEK